MPAHPSNKLSACRRASIRLNPGIDRPEPLENSFWRLRIIDGRQNCWTIFPAIRPIIPSWKLSSAKIMAEGKSLSLTKPLAFSVDWIVKSCLLNLPLTMFWLILLLLLHCLCIEVLRNQWPLPAGLWRLILGPDDIRYCK